MHMPRRHTGDRPSGPRGLRPAAAAWWRSRGPRWAAVLCGVLLVAAAFGSGGTSAATAAPAAAQPPPADVVEPDPGDVAAGVAAPVDPAAPPAYQPVARNGKRPQPTVVANRGGFSAAAPVNFPDGVSVRVDKVARGTEQGEGPGVFRGRPHTAFTLSLTNGSTSPIDLTQVVVTATYGSPPRLASPVYEGAAAADFTGTVAPGATASATYLFAIPPGQARSAVMTVDFADSYAAATFTGLE